MASFHGGGGVDDAVGETGTGFDHRAGPENGVGDVGIAADFAVGSNPGIGDGCSDFDSGRFVDGREVFSGFERGADAVGFEIGLAGAEVEPMPGVSVEGAELALSGEDQKGGDDRDLFVRGDEVEDLRIDAVDSGELVAALGDLQHVADVDDLRTTDGEVLARAVGSGGEGRGVFGSGVAGDELVDPDVGEDVPVVDQDGIACDEGLDVLDATAGLEEVFFVEKVKLEVLIATQRESAFPFLVQVVGVDGDFFNACRGEVIEGVGGEGTVEDGDQRLGHGIGHRAQAGAESGSEEKCFFHLPRAWPEC